MAFEQARETVKMEINARKHEEKTLQMEKALRKQAGLIIFDKTLDSMLKEDA